MKMFIGKFDLVWRGYRELSLLYDRNGSVAVAATLERI
jgi:hypothetical protein